MFRVGEVLFFKISFFYVWVDFLVIVGGFGVIWEGTLGAKGCPKWLQNLMEKMSDFLIALGNALGRQKSKLVR